MSSGYTGLAAGSLKRQTYYNFRGVDFTDDAVNETRSPDSLNMWKNYKSLGKKIETRPDIELQLQLENTIYGLFFYTINNVDHWIIHSGVSLYDYNPNTKALTILKANGMNPFNSTAFIYNNLFFMIDGINYLEYNGSTIKNVEGTIPLTSIGRKPAGGGTQYQDINLISDYRKNSFWSDGTSTEYHLDATGITSGSVTVWISDTEQSASSYSVDAVNGIITFNTAPTAAIDEDNVVIQFAKPVSGYANKIKKCTIATMFDNRVFFSGNQDYPNAVFWCSYNDPRYISDMNYALEGTDIAKVKSMVAGNNALWVFKEPSQANTTVFYHVPLESYDERLGDTVKTYPSVHSSISTGCAATGINFNDDICFFSDRGMEGITGDITTEQVLAHRSSLVDRKMLNEENYKRMVLAEWEGYLLVIIDDTVYLANSRETVANADHNEYEWFYWKLAKKMRATNVHNNVLYLCSERENVYDDNGYIKYTDGLNFYWYDSENEIVYDTDYEETQISVETLTPIYVSGIYTLTNNNENRDLESYWTTKSDDFDYPQMLKTTNKRGFKSDVSGLSVTIEVKTDNNNFETLGTYNNTKGYIVAKLKRKKWNKIQLKFGSKKPFGIYEIVLESYIGSYVKRS